MKKTILGISILLPSFALAAGTIKSAAYAIATFLGKPLMALLFTIALVMFLWGVLEFIKNAENSEEREKGKQKMLWGIIGLFAMVSFLGLTGVLTGTFFNNDKPLLPQFYETQ
jgi:uncharacterized membrane protein